MAPSKQEASHIVIREATHSDVQSLKTILPRAYYPVNEYVKKALPDTPEMRRWWETVFCEEISSPACHLLIAHDTSTNIAAGVMPLRLVNPGDPTGGFWTEHPWTPDHNEEMWRGPIDCLTEYERRIVGSRRHLHLELFGVDHSYQGLSIGKRLLERACEIADEEGVPIFLQSGISKGYYLSTGLGFEIRAEPDWNGYKSCHLIREPRSE